MFVGEGKEYASGAGIDNGVSGVRGRVMVMNSVSVRVILINMVKGWCRDYSIVSMRLGRRGCRQWFIIKVRKMFK